MTASSGPHLTPSRSQGGFTLVELVIVIVITAVIAVSLALVIRPTVDAYVDSRARSEAVDLADSALRRMLRDVRLAVPNSIRIPDTRCFELVPGVSGGRFRMGPDTVNDSGPGCTPGANCAAPLDGTRAVTSIDVLSRLAPVPSPGDFIVINNQTTNDVYAGTNRATLTGVSTPDSRYGRHRLSMAATEFPTGYGGGRFMIVSASQQAVFYVCEGANGAVDSQGDGLGVLYRLKRPFDATYPASCPSVSGADVVATKVRSCTFVYDPNHGATQQSGFIWMELTLTRHHEDVHLATGAHVENAP